MSEIVVHVRYFTAKDADNTAKDSASGDDSEDIAAAQEGADDVQGNGPGDEGRARSARRLVCSLALRYRPALSV